MLHTLNNSDNEILSKNIPENITKYPVIRL